MELTDTGDDLAIVRASIELAHAMGLRVVAEGLETESAWQLLLGLGCERAQGFLISRPMMAEQLESWIEEWEQVRRAARANGGRRRLRQGHSLKDPFAIEQS
jgi:EAL domain-containing protein (putative c-di-GMP-specific phosphodiesterase class I)